jgi:bifunctional non-homologous end joining protein LigD
MSLDRGLFAFVVHKHKATSLHYDFRLEIGETMPSWSIPKGPTLDPGVRRLAMPTGPHDLEYRNFEGVIPKGEYGAGPVMVWDEGLYTPEVEVSRGVRRRVTGRQEGADVAAAGLRDGNLKFTLHGKKLRGSFALVRTKGLGSSREAWLLIKHRDKYCVAGHDANKYDFSARTNRSISEIASRGGP